MKTEERAWWSFASLAIIWITSLIASVKIDQPKIFFATFFATFIVVMFHAIMEIKALSKER